MGSLRSGIQLNLTDSQASGVSDGVGCRLRLRHSAQSGCGECIQTSPKTSALGETNASEVEIRKEGEAVSTGVIQKSILSRGLLDPIEPWRLGSEILAKRVTDHTRQLANAIINKVATTSAKFNKKICQQYDGTVREITGDLESTCSQGGVTKLPSQDEKLTLITQGPGKKASAVRVISRPQMPDKSGEAESLLDDIQKGRSDDLEEKSLPILSKVCDYPPDPAGPVMNYSKPALDKGCTGAPPHLKARFEGSAKLTFNHEKEITHMESAENEKVELVLRIIPASAKGLVEE